MNDGHTDLDAIDLAIIGEIQLDCKQSLQKLGEQVGMSAPSVLDRVRKLEQAGVIRGYHADIDARAVGLDITAFIGVSINYPKQIDAFEAWVSTEPRVLECHHVTGGSTLLLKVRARNTAGLEELISAIRELEGADRTETMVVLSTHAERKNEPLSAAAVRPRARRVLTSARSSTTKSSKGGRDGSRGDSGTGGGVS